MPIETPILDDLRYDQLRERLIRLIPVYAPEWTDHNESDPGIAMIELFSVLAEQIGYRLNRVPEKNHVELLKLLGVRLGTARAASTALAFLLSHPASATALRVKAGIKAAAKKGDPPPVFETDVDFDLVPAEPIVLVTTKHDTIWDLVDGESDDVFTGLAVPAAASPVHFVVWDGKKPKLKDMPKEPVSVVSPESGGLSEFFLWIGLDGNLAAGAGFRNVRVTMTVQFDDDEQPQPQATAKCGCASGATAELAPESVSWLWYFDAKDGAMRNVSGRIDDSTAAFTRSGALRFTIPTGIGPIPADMFADLIDAKNVRTAQDCELLAMTGNARLLALGATLDRDDAESLPGFVDRMQTAIAQTLADNNAAGATTAVPHPLDPKLRDPGTVKAWLRVGPLRSCPKLRMLTFNAAKATNAITVSNEFLGIADGRPGQEYSLGHGNILEGTLRIAIQEEPGQLLTPWLVRESLDDARSGDRVVEVDWEAGRLRFGDGERGRIPPLVRDAGNIVALHYRYGGGSDGEVLVGDIVSLESPLAGISGCVNVVGATGGADAERLEDAKLRARKELSTRRRAVTAEDFRWLAARTPTVRVKRVEVVPLRRPLCGGAGLDDATVAHGAVSVVVVPDVDDPRPMPAPSFLRAVCEHLDRHRLVTTEVHVVPPQYMRLHDFRVEVKAKPGYTRAMLQDAVRERLAKYLHVFTGGDGINPDECQRGFPFGGQVHVADLIAIALKTEGVERVVLLMARFERSKTGAVPGRGMLTLCPRVGVDEHQSIDLAPEENVWMDGETFTLSTAD